MRAKKMAVQDEDAGNKTLESRRPAALAAGPDDRWPVIAAV
jgi:hypothetical protein